MKRNQVLCMKGLALGRLFDGKSLLQEDYELIEASTGSELVDLACTHKPDVILTELSMPDMDGEEICRKVKGTPELASTPVVVVVEPGRPGDLERCRAAGCDDVVFQPVTPTKLAEVIGRPRNAGDFPALRYPARLEISYTSREGRQKLTNYSVNISTGGLFLETTQPLEVGTPLSLSINLPDRGEPLRCSARVAWANHPEYLLKSNLPPGVGLQFLDLSLADLHLLRDFLRRLVDESLR
ncbi:MAG: TIGR02266 family protein [Deferrisomatales bacterium]